MTAKKPVRRAGATGRPQRVTKLGIPRTALERKFCERWLHHFDHVRAYKEAGFKNTRNNAQMAAKLLERLDKHLRPLREAKAREVAKLLTASDEDVLKAMSAKAVFNADDFVEVATSPKTRTIKIGDKESIEPIEWDGQPVFASRLKPWEKLTPDQKRTVEVIGDSGGEVRYRLPNTREQHQYLTSVGRQYGMFLEKIIQEKHFHRHQHQHLEIEAMPTAKLQSLTAQLLPFVGQEFASQLGFTPDDIETARKSSDIVLSNGKA